MILTSCERPAPPDIRETDAKAIRELEGTWSKMMGTKDAAKFASSYADEAALYITGFPVMHGTEAISTGLKGIMDHANFSSTFKITRVHVAKSGEGTYDETGTDLVLKKKVPGKANYLTCWMKPAAK